MKKDNNAKASNLHQKAEELLPSNNLSDFAPSANIIISKEGKIIEINPKGASMLGKEKQKLLNNIFSFFVSNNSKPTYYLFLNKAFKSKVMGSCEVSIANKRGNFISNVQLCGRVLDKDDQCLLTMVEIN